MKKTLLYSFLFAIGFSSAQQEASNWYFGENAGITFNLGSNTVSKTSDGQLYTREGCSSISDESGNLLFYTDGTIVYNKTHNVMQNGFGLFGDYSSTQSAIVIPKPENPNIYYVFTVDDRRARDDDVNFGLNYSEIDMSLDGGLGAVTSKNINLVNETSEKVTAVLKNCITKSIWVVTFASEDGLLGPYTTFYAFEVSKSGVNINPVKSNLGSYIYEGRGYLKLSPDGKKMAIANVRDGLFVYDFDPQTGIVSNELQLQIPIAERYAYGIEFSPNSKLLYVHSSNDYFGDERDNPSAHYSSLTQFNLMTTNIQQSAVTIDDRELYRGALQLGPNGKIYRALSATYETGIPYLGVIQNPDIVGLGCNYVHNAVNLSPNNSSQGLPPFIASFFNTQIDIIKNGRSNINLALCDGDSYTLTSEILPDATYTWTLDNVVLPETDFDLEVSKAGKYEVYIEPNNGECAIEGHAFVRVNPNPEAFDHSLFQCDEDGFVDGFTQFNLNEIIDELTGSIPQPTVEFYLDASRTIEINGESFNNISNPQIIYVKVIDDVTDCYSYSELTLKISVTDANDVVLPAVCDDDGTEDGLHIFDLNDAKDLVTNGLPAGLNVAYYETYDDALLEKDNLGSTFTNTIPYSQIIYARVEDANNCYGISEITLTVIELPNIDTEDIAYYCLNKFPETITIDAALLNDSPSNYSYNWSSGETTYQIQINQPGNYEVSVTNANGCTKQRTVIIEPSNVAIFESFEVIDVSENNTITVFVSGEGIYEYRLVDSNNMVVVPDQENNVFENVRPGIYTVFVTDKKNNCGTVKDKVSVLGFPKFFTPNNDGVNDTWQIIGVSEMFQANTKILIFNRFGKLIKALDPLGEGWDGLVNGQNLPSDDYWFSVELQDGRIFKNHFTLKY